MDGLLNARMTLQSLSNATAAIAAQRLKFLDYARLVNLHQLWGQVPPTWPQVEYHPATGIEVRKAEQDSTASRGSGSTGVVFASPDSLSPQALSRGRLLSDGTVQPKRKEEGQDGSAQDDGVGAQAMAEASASSRSSQPRCRSLRLAR